MALPLFLLNLRLHRWACHLLSVALLQLTSRLWLSRRSLRLELLRCLQLGFRLLQLLQLTGRQVELAVDQAAGLLVFVLRGHDCF